MCHFLMSSQVISRARRIGCRAAIVLDGADALASDFLRIFDGFNECEEKCEEDRHSGYPKSSTECEALTDPPVLG